MRREIVHLELHTPSLQDATDFCRSLFGWLPTTTYDYVSVDAGLSTGIVSCGTPTAVWIPYIAVDDVDASTATAVELGASLTLEPRTGPTGRRSVVRSAVAGDLALWKPS
jgi:predicted enzyme related to lactoylglutathione lyase